MTEPFSARLRASTATIHDEVEHTDFMVDLMEGRLDANAYTLLLRQYEVIYEALETKSREHAGHPVFAPFHDANLYRYDRIISDLSRLTNTAAAGPNGTGLPVTGSAEPVTGRAQAYAAHLNRLEEPEELIAHHYTRYLGDLSGGQAIGALMGRHYGLGDSALTMWDFTDLGKTKPYKDVYRRRLDEIADTGGDEQLVLDETMTAFALNGDLLAELTELTSLSQRPASSVV